MLGDYMIGVSYAEFEISEITLALFKDSGWYEVNYYTGGLFRFGKGQGCEFLNSFCLTSGKSNFKWDFCDYSENVCSSNNLNRGFCQIKNYSEELPSYYQYFDNSYTGGYNLTDYCPISRSSSSYCYYETSCVNGINEELYISIVGFLVSENSICMKSTLNHYSSDIIFGQRAMCYKIKCNFDSKTFTVDLGYSTIDCPTEGGDMEVTGYTGKITCPPFNRVCTSNPYVSSPIQAALNHVTNIDLNLTNIDDILNNEESIESKSKNMISNSDNSEESFHSIVNKGSSLNSNSLNFNSMDDLGSFNIIESYDSSSSTYIENVNNISYINNWNKYLYLFILLLLWVKY